MDIVNTKIGQGIAKEQTAMINDKSFAASNMVGTSGGVSQFTKSETDQASQQARNVEKSYLKLSDEQILQSLKKTKVNRPNADTTVREDNVGLLQSLGNINTLMQTNGTKISFSFEHSLENGEQKPVVIVTDQDSGNVIRQIPSEEVQKFAEQIRDLESGSTSPSGLMLNKQA